MRVTVSVGVAASSLLSVPLSSGDELGVMSEGGAADLASHLSVHWLADLPHHWAALLHRGLHWHAVRN